MSVQQINGIDSEWVVSSMNLYVAHQCGLYVWTYVSVI